RSAPPQRDTKIPQPPRRRLGDPQRPEGSGPQGLNQANRPGPASRCDSGQAEALAEPVDLIAQFGRNRIAELGVPFLDESEFGLPLLGFDGQCLAQLLVGEVETLCVQTAL